MSSCSYTLYKAQSLLLMRPDTGSVCSYLYNNLSACPQAYTTRSLLGSSGCEQEEAVLAGDFPDVVRYREILQAYDITAFPKLRESMLKAIEDSLSVDIPSLVRQFDNPYA